MTVYLDDIKTVKDVREQLPELYKHRMASIPNTGGEHSAAMWLFFGRNLGGHFFTALINNKLVESFNRADDMNTVLMRDWVVWLYNSCPNAAWGSEDTLDEWERQGGLIGLMIESERIAAEKSAKAELIAADEEADNA